ncbi:hypothetical protein [Streptomyces sp. NPDC048106]|uniref:hypothetical protein n=1 Tax=Streptomyces sp. NPDC048106 TaxID=3155750 RepID=UPI0034565E63
MLSRPVDVRELVAAEASWIAVESSVYSAVPLLVTLAVGLPVGPALLLVAFTAGMWLLAVRGMNRRLLD